MLLLSLKSYPAFCLLNDHLFQSQVLFINQCIQQAIKRCISQDIFKHNAESIDSNATLSVYINLLIDTLPQTFYIQKTVTPVCLVSPLIWSRGDLIKATSIRRYSVLCYFVGYFINFSKTFPVSSLARFVISL